MVKQDGTGAKRALDHVETQPKAVIGDDDMLSCNGRHNRRPSAERGKVEEVRPARDRLRDDGQNRRIIIRRP